MKNPVAGNAVAVVGLGCWYPGARNPKQLWENVLARRRQFRRLPESRLSSEYHDPDKSRPDQTYNRRASVIDGFQFDWANHLIPYSTFHSSDVTHWLALEVAISAILDAGYDADEIPRERTGVIVGNSLGGEQTRANTLRLRWPYVRRAFRESLKARGVPEAHQADLENTFEVYFKSVFPPVDEDTLAGSLANTIAGRICNILGFHGGGYTVDGACSSSLLAVATAANALIHGDLDLALAGGVDVSLDPLELVGFSKTGALTDGDMRVYDRDASGFLPGEGCGFVVLKRLDDARRNNDYVYAVLRGWGVSSDGRGRSITMPSAEGQARALRRAYERAGYSPSTLNFIEGHGTGTKVGDQQEILGISLAFGDDSAALLRSCGLTSLKSVIGHCKAAAGIGGFIKAVMATNRRILPPTAACDNPLSTFENQARCLYPIRLGQVLQPTDTLRGGVSAMGFGGINCHVTLESADPPSPRLQPDVPERALLVSNQVTEVFAFSADSVEDMKRQISILEEMVPDIAMAEMADLASQTNHKAEVHRPIRAALVADAPESLLRSLTQLLGMLESALPSRGSITTDPSRSLWLSNQADATRVGMLFPGQGTQQINMARTLVERFPWARQLVSETDSWLVEQGGDPISGLVFRSIDRVGSKEELQAWGRALEPTEIAQPAICLASVLWFQFLERLGIRPVVVGGHSLGELTAFHVAGAFDARSLMQLAAIRGQAMAASSPGAGAMASLLCSVDRAASILDRVDGYVVVANINSPNQVAISGEVAAVEEALRLASDEGILIKRLPVSNAFHSRIVSAAADTLRNLAPVPETLGPLRIRLFTALSGTLVSPGIPLREHFARQVLARVDFVSLIRSMRRECDIFIEVGPGRVLSGLVEDITEAAGPACLGVERLPGRDQDLNTVVAGLFVHGVNLRWDELYENRLLRTFQAPKDRHFIENPCERPFTDIVLPTGGPALNLPGGDLEARIGQLIGHTPADVASYLASRLPFVADIIGADLRHSGGQYPVAASVPVVQRLAAPATNPPAPPSQYTSTWSVVVQVIHKKTRIPSENIREDMRLLDELHVDSIKAGVLIGEIATQCGVAGRVSPSALLGHRLVDIAAEIDRIRGDLPAPVIDTPPATIPGTNPDQILEVLLDEAGRVTGYPRSLLDPDRLVEQELGLGPEKLLKILDGSVSRLHMEGNVDLEPLRFRTLRQIAGIFGKMNAPQASFRVSDPSREAPSWTREFVMERIPCPLPARPSNLARRQEDNWETACALIVGDPENTDMVEALGNHLLSLGAQARCATFDEAGPLSKDPRYSHIFAFMPRTCDSSHGMEERIRRHVGRVASIAGPPPASMAPRRRTSLAWIQFGSFGLASAQVPQPEQGCAIALASSVHLERSDLRVRVVDFSPGLPPEKVAECTIAEVSSSSPFATAGYDFQGNRHVLHPRQLQPSRYPPRRAILNADDVFLVTGGARGITARCALELAQTTGVRMALLGRSLHPDTDPDDPATGEIRDTLRRYRESGLDAHYYSADITDAGAVSSAVARIRAEMGPITGVIHGAALNQPRATDRVSPDEAMTEIAPKVLGAIHILQALASTPPRLILALSSIIGVTGMQRNGWYGFSNEVMECLFRRFTADNPSTRLQCLAYSVWDEIGMGARTGAVEHLRQQGTFGIPAPEGSKRFVRLAQNDPGTTQVIICSRLGGLDTWRSESPDVPAGARFLRHIAHYTPGVECVARSQLSMDHDAYLQDHVFKGTCILPTVFGLEAMAQAVVLATGRPLPARLGIRDVLLTSPIPVDPRKGAEIEVQAEVLERRAGQDLTEVRCAVRNLRWESTNPAFSATFVLGAEAPMPQAPPPLATEPMMVDPTHGFYDRLLFHGPRFRRIERILGFAGASERAEHVVCELTETPPADLPALAFTRSEDRRFLLGDPFLRDALLHASQLNVPQDTCLPVSIRKIEVQLADGPANTASGQPTTCHCFLTRVEPKAYEARVVMVGADGQVRECLEGLMLHVMEHHPQHPTAAQLARPDERDIGILDAIIEEATVDLGLRVPTVQLRRIPSLVGMPPEARHEIEGPHFHHVVKRHLEGNAGGPLSFEVAWLPNGRPFIRGLEPFNLGLSLSHDDADCLFATDIDPMGCDIASVTPRKRDAWQTLLGPPTERAMEDLLVDGDGLDRAGTRCWTALEATVKAVNSEVQSLVRLRRAGSAVLFRARTANQDLLVLTFPVTFTWGPERVIGLVVREAPPTTQLAEAVARYRELTEMKWAEVRDGGPQGQPIYIQRFPLTFRVAAQVNRNVYFANWFYWMGDAREGSIWPVLGELARQCLTGEYGLVTNHSWTRIVGEATTHDRIEVRQWVSHLEGDPPSTMDITYDWRKILPDGSHVRVARSTQRTTWVRILGPGQVAREGYPPYLLDFIRAMLPRYEAPDVLENLPEPLADLGIGSESFRAPRGPGSHALLRSEILPTAQDYANLVGNIYFGHYYRWQGHVRDRYFHSLAPELFLGLGTLGDFFCAESEVDHLREAMPFDDIRVSMYLEALGSTGVDLLFEYHREESGGPVLLAIGRHRAVWVRRNEHGRCVAAPIPPAVLEALTRAAREELE